MRRRKGHIVVTRKAKGAYYFGVVGVARRQLWHGSYDRSEVEGWIARTVAENPLYSTGDGFRAAREAKLSKGLVGRTGSRLWAVTAECDPCTANYHLFTRPDWPKPERVLLVDEVNCVPIMWVADDNRGEGWRTEEEARERARELSDGGAVAYRARTYDGVWETREGWRVRR